MMPSDTKPIIIDMDSPGVDLKFEKFSPSTHVKEEPSGFNNLPTTENSQTCPKYSIWSLEYFQQFFDVDTDTVLSRVKGALIPKFGCNYLQSHIKNKPDLYGPFWICITLVFTIGISGNMANYLQASNGRYHWKYNFHAVSSAATAIFSYAWLYPAILWLVLQYHGSQHFQLPLLELICVYGYSLSAYIPISVLWVIQISWMQWSLVFFGAALSGYILITSIAPAFGNKNYALLLVSVSLHVLLAVGFMLYFFHVPPMTASAVDTSHQDK